MLIKTLRSTSGLLVYLTFLLVYIPSINATSLCSYYDAKPTYPRTTPCPDVCCTFTNATRLNTACCSAPTIVVTTTTFFGYRWWAIFITIGCLSCALALTMRYFKRSQMASRWQMFNQAVAPGPIAVISKSDGSANPGAPVFYYSAQNDMVVFENAPPCYSTVVAPPPPYTTTATFIPLSKPPPVHT